MMANQQDIAGYRRVLKIVSVPELAKACEIARQSVYDWGGVIPERYLMRVSYLTGIPPEKISPSVVREWKALQPKDG